MSLKKQATEGIVWTAVERLGQQLLQGIVFIILARLLTPEDFGLIAMLLIFFAVAQSFVDSGMGQALIREKKITDNDRSTVFWFNMLVSCIFYGILFFTAPYIASFYEQPELTVLSRIMGLSVIFFGFAIVQRAELTQRMNFKKQAVVQLPAVLLSGVVSVIMAYMGYGVWALAIQYLLLALLSSVFLWIAKPHKIGFLWNRQSFHRLFGFGYKLLLSGLLDTIYKHIYKLVIGKFFAAATLGFYTQAKKLQELSSNSLVGVIQKVTYPLLSKIEGGGGQLKNAYRQVLQGSSFLIFPGILVLILLAKPIMVYILGEQWAPAAPFLQLVCLSGMLTHLHAINLNLLKVLGRSDLFLKLEIIKKINVTIAIIVGLQFGIYGLLVGHVITSYIALLINTYYTNKFLNYTIIQQLRDVFSVLLLSAPTAVVIVLLKQVLAVDSLMILCLYLALSAVLYIVTNRIYKTTVSKTVFDVLIPYLPKKLQKIAHP